MFVGRLRPISFFLSAEAKSFQDKRQQQGRMLQLGIYSPGELGGETQSAKWTFPVELFSIPFGMLGNYHAMMIPGSHLTCLGIVTIETQLPT